MKWIVGIDEVGRGALAGPVVVAAAALLQKAGPPRSVALGPLKDSKKLTAKKREAWCAYFNDHTQIQFAVARVYPRQIERRNISKAANVAAERAFDRLVQKYRLDPKISVFLDGGLFLGNSSQRGIGDQGKIKNAKTIIKGDEKINAIKVASIVAKVHRDKFMRGLAKKYPAYGFEVHKGYGTTAHMAAIKKHGASAAHRLTFLGKTHMIKRN